MVGDWAYSVSFRSGASVVVTEVYLAAGSHTYSLSGRSNGVAIDAIRIYLKGTTPPDP